MDQFRGPGGVTDAGRPFALRLVADLAGAARQAAGTSLLALSTREKAAVLDELAAARRAVEAAHLSVLRALDGQDLSELGATTLPGLVSGRLRVPPGRARSDVAAARATDPDGGPLAGLGAALAAGEVSMAHVDVAAAVLAKIPVGIREQVAATIDEFMVDTSRRYRPREVANLAREILDRLDPDRHERGHDEKAFTRRGFTLSPDAYGMGVVSGQLDPATFAILKAALDHFSAPTPTQRDAAGEPLFGDERSATQRRNDALGEIARRALATAGQGAEGATRAGEPPRVVVHASAEQATGADPAGTVYAEGTGAIPAAFLKGLLCDCLLERVLLAPNGAVLNLGRAVRTATAAQRRALAARDQGCVWPGCTIPARWSDVHHAPAWIHGGRTDIAALALLCGGHHAQVEHGHYEITMVDGIPHVTPPTWIDPQRRPVRNTYWLDQQAAKNTGRQLAFDVGITPRARGTPGPCPARPQTHPPPDGG